MPTLNQLLNSGEAAFRGLAQGATAGLIQYPQAAVMAGQRAAEDATDTRSMPTARRGSMPRQGFYTGGTERQVSATPKVMFQQALADLREDNKKLAEENPVAWYGGNVVGAAGTALATGGTSLPAMLGTNAALGAVSGFTEKESAMDAGIGAGLGLVFGAGGKLINAATGKLKNKVVEEFIKPYRSSNPGTALTDKEIIEQILTQEHSRFPMLRSLYDTGKGIASNTLSIAKEAAVPAITGGATGAAANLMIGEDPWKGAATGATIFLAAAKQQAARDAASRAANWGGAVAIKNPQLTESVVPTAAKLGTLATSQVSAKMNNPPQATEQPVTESAPWATDSTPSLESAPWKK